MKIQLKDSNKLKLAMIENGYTQTSFAQALGIHRSYLSQIINGKNLGPKIAYKICDLLKVKFDEVFFVNVLTKVS